MRAVRGRHQRIESGDWPAYRYRQAQFLHYSLDTMLPRHDAASAASTSGVLFGPEMDCDDSLNAGTTFGVQAIGKILNVVEEAWLVRRPSWKRTPLTATLSLASHVPPSVPTLRLGPPKAWTSACSIAGNATEIGRLQSIKTYQDVRPLYQAQ